MLCICSLPCFLCLLSQVTWAVTLCLSHFACYQYVFSDCLDLFWYETLYFKLNFSCLSWLWQYISLPYLKNIAGRARTQAFTPLLCWTSKEVSWSVRVEISALAFCAVVLLLHSPLGIFVVFNLKWCGRLFFLLLSVGVKTLYRTSFDILTCIRPVFGS